jgi:actin-related protein 2
VQGRDAGLARLKLKVLDPPLRQHVVYTGAAILGDVLAGFDAGWTTKAEYDEDPARAVRAACAELPGS